MHLDRFFSRRVPNAQSCFSRRKRCLGLLGLLKEEKPMQTNRIAAIRPNLWTRTVYLFLLFFCSHLAGGAAPLQITASSLLNGKFALTWMGSANSYEVQRTESLAAPNWTTVLATVRTNVRYPFGRELRLLSVAKCEHKFKLPDPGDDEFDDGRHAHAHA